MISHTTEWFLSHYFRSQFTVSLLTYSWSSPAIATNSLLTLAGFLFSARNSSAVFNLTTMFTKLRRILEPRTLLYWSPKVGLPPSLSENKYLLRSLATEVVVNAGYITCPAAEQWSINVLCTCNEMTPTTFQAPHSEIPGHHPWVRGFALFSSARGS